MNGPLDSTMREAMRLMQTGDLLAATTAIQQRLGGASKPESQRAAAWVTDPIEGTFRVVDETRSPTQDASSGSLPGRTADARCRTQFSEHAYTCSAGSRRYKLRSEERRVGKEWR